MYRNYHSTQFVTGLRGVAAFLVFLIHAGGGGLRDVSTLMNTFVDWGQYGVDIFFVISGYTIFYQFYEKGYNLRNFIIQRMARLSVPYYPLLILLFIMGWIGMPIGGNPWGNGAHGADIELLNWILHATYLNFWSANYSNTIIGVEWTLSIEFFYYVLLGMILNSVLFRKSKSALALYITLALLLFGIAQIGNNLIVENKIDNYLDILWSPMLYGFMFVMGGLAYFFRKKVEGLLDNQKLIQVGNVVSILVLVFFILNLILNSSGVDFIGFPSIPLMFAFLTFILLIFLRNESFFGKILTSKIFQLFGGISYSFYLWHFIVLTTVATNAYFSFEIPALDFFYKLLITIAIASIWNYIFEYKIYLKLRNRWDKYE